MKKILVLNGNSNSDLEELARKTTDGDCAELANSMSVCKRSLASFGEGR